jgi:creatinine amidohydrolase
MERGADMQLQLCSWPEVERYLEKSTTIIVPIGSAEQHGPIGLIGTDAICPEVVARGVAEQTVTLVAPTLSLGMAQHHLAFPGSIALRPSTLMVLINDVVRSLLRHGFDHIYFLNGHGGNIATVTATFSEIWADASFAGESRPAPRLRLYNWWSGERVRGLSRELFGGAEGSHATPSEVSLSYYAYPQAVKQAPLSPKVAPVGTIRDAADYRRQFADGRIGSDPSLASVEHGERLYHAAVADVGEDLRRFGSTD